MMSAGSGQKMRGWPKRKFRVGQIVCTKSGVPAKVIGLATYGSGTSFSWNEYRLKTVGKKKTFYKRESALKRCPRTRKKSKRS